SGDWRAPTARERWQVVAEHLASHLAFVGKADADLRGGRGGPGGSTGAEGRAAARAPHGTPGQDEPRGIRRFRQHMLWYAHGLRGAAAFRREVTVIDRLDALLDRCAAFFLHAEGDVDRAEVELDTRAAVG